MEMTHQRVVFTHEGDSSGMYRRMVAFLPTRPRAGVVDSDAGGVVDPWWRTPPLWHILSSQGLRGCSRTLDLSHNQ